MSDSQIGQKQDQTGPCTTYTSSGQCSCQGFEFYQADQHYRICHCTHTQQMHQLRDVTCTRGSHCPIHTGAAVAEEKDIGSLAGPTYVDVRKFER